MKPSVSEIREKVANCILTQDCKQSLRKQFDLPDDVKFDRETLDEIYNRGPDTIPFMVATRLVHEGSRLSVYMNLVPRYKDIVQNYDVEFSFFTLAYLFDHIQYTDKSSKIPDIDWKPVLDDVINYKEFVRLDGNWLWCLKTGCRIVRDCVKWGVVLFLLCLIFLFFGVYLTGISYKPSL